jgi:hypothetical protein
LPLDYTIAPKSKLDEDETEETKSNENITHKKFMRTLQLVRAHFPLPAIPTTTRCRPFPNRSRALGCAVMACHRRSSSATFRTKHPEASRLL